MAVYSEAVREKALRYVTEGRIRPESTTGPITSWLAHSEDGESVYRTIVGPAWTMCACQATTTCCHRVGASWLDQLRKLDPAAYADLVRRLFDERARQRRPIDAEEVLPV
jgi:hypothetical protein